MLPIMHQAVLAERHWRRKEILILQRRVLRETHQPFQLPSQAFINLFRLNKMLARELIDLLRPHLFNRVNRRGVTAECAVLCSLRFYATGSYQRSLGEEYNFGLGQSTVQKYIHIVTDAIVEHIVPLKIKFPTQQEDRNRIKVEFLNRWGFPGTIGAIDGTHIAILKPTVDEHNFINRKGFHSINTQIICDYNLRITNVYANFGGSTHDSFIWRNSAIREYIRDLQRNERCWLIGDSGYPLETCPLTPFRNPNTVAERYNTPHILARNCVERCIGVMKMRFRCIMQERKPRYAPEFACKLIKVAATLHNICIDGNIPLNEEIDVEYRNHRNADNNLEDPEGMQRRRDIVINITSHFAKSLF